MKFYQKTWFIILMLFVLPPVGIILMWTGKKFNKIIRIILTVFFAFATLFQILLYSVAFDETENVPETTSNISVSTTESNNILMTSKLIEAPVMNGFRTEEIGGTYAYIKLSDSDFDKLTPDDYYEFAKKVVDNSGYNWVSVVSQRGYGACWSPLYIGTLSFGFLNDDYSIEKTEEMWEIKDNTYVPLEDETKTTSTTKKVTTTEKTTNTTTKKATSTSTPTKQITTTKKQTTTQNAPKGDGRTVYTAPTGKRYHFDPDCGGKNSSATTLDNALSRGLTPCQKCAY